MGNKKQTPTRALLGLLIIALIVLIAACGGSSETSSTTTTAAPTTTAPPTTSGATPSSSSVALTGEEAVIAGNFTKFFDGSLPVADKVGLLENGQQYTEELETQAASPMGQAASVAVSAVKITSPSTADVAYTILLAGTPALPNQTGQAVLQDNVWKVSAQTFLGLLALQGGATPTS